MPCRVPLRDIVIVLIVLFPLVMHRVYQQDLYKLRLNTARCFVDALESSSNPLSTGPLEEIKLSTRVCLALFKILCMHVTNH